jgi:hypothetical protein
MQMHRWASLLKQQTPITIYCLPTKENKLLFPFAAKKQKFAVSVFLLQQTNRSLRFRFPYIYIVIVLYIQKTELYIYVYTYTVYIFIYILYTSVSNGKRKPRRFSLIRLPFAIVQAVVVICPFVDEETNRSYAKN